jgi:hypothetical protein
MELNEIETAQVVTRVLSGESWSSVAGYFGTTHHKIRRVVANNLRLHIPYKGRRK